MNNIIRPSCFCYYRLEIEFLLCIDCFIGFDTLQRCADNRPIFSSYIRHESRSIIVIQLIAPFSPGNVCNNHTNHCYKKPHDFFSLYTCSIRTLLRHNLFSKYYFLSIIFLYFVDCSNRTMMNVEV